MVTILHWIFPNAMPSMGDLPVAIMYLVLFVEFAAWINETFMTKKKKK